MVAVPLRLGNRIRIAYFDQFPARRLHQGIRKRLWFLRFFYRFFFHRSLHPRIVFSVFFLPVRGEGC